MVAPVTAGMRVEEVQHLIDERLAQMEQGLGSVLPGLGVSAVAVVPVATTTTSTMIWISLDTGSSRTDPRRDP